MVLKFEERGRFGIENNGQEVVGEKVTHHHSSDILITSYIQIHI